MLFVQKQPLNPIENPVYGCIRKDPPVFKEAGKAWKARADDILLDQADNLQMVDGIILAESRDRNQTQYGKRSYTHKVNRAFRPPLIPLEDQVPLSRLPRPTTQVRLNPAIPFQTMNPVSVEGRNFIKQQLCANSIRPTFFNRIDQPLPDAVINLAPKRENISLEGTRETPIFFNNTQNCDPQLQKIGWTWETRNKAPVQVHSNHYIPLSLQQENQEQTLLEHNPKVFANAGREYDYKTSQANEDYKLERRAPAVFANAKREYFMNMDAQQPDIELELHNPSVFVHSAKSAPVQTSHEAPIKELEKRNPSVFASAGHEYAVNLADQKSNPIILEQKRQTISTNAGKLRIMDTIQDRNMELKQRVIHTNAETGRASRSMTDAEHGRQNVRMADRISVSSRDNKESPVKAQQLNENVHLRQTLAPNRGNVFTSSSAIPTFGEVRREPTLRKKKLGPVPVGF